ncbi:hypothetical protein B0H13DRAFT_2307331 [Mycena leptocephala]|nr:hypothetical protein B0H13DRAFT_2310290 [Mycena leptocephala]KAJ7933055.1 hypothetical protein B0H13DRAFT_2307331 [Mycena leptocephala]
MQLAQIENALAVWEDTAEACRHEILVQQRAHQVVHFEFRHARGYQLLNRRRTQMRRIHEKIQFATRRLRVAVACLSSALPAVVGCFQIGERHNGLDFYMRRHLPVVDASFILHRPRLPLRADGAGDDDDQIPDLVADADTDSPPLRAPSQLSNLMSRSTLRTDEIRLSIEQMLDRDVWRLRGETECTCGGEALYHCTVCTSPNMCKECLIWAHIPIPFHDVMEWSERAVYFTRTTLRDIGLRIALGHEGGTCPQGRAERLEAITDAGVKSVAVEFCCCPDAPSDKDQLKTRGWLHMRSNFVSALSLEVLKLVFAPEPEPADESQSDSESETSETSGSDASGSSGSAE